MYIFKNVWLQGMPQLTYPWLMRSHYLCGPSKVSFLLVTPWKNIGPRMKIVVTSMLRQLCSRERTTVFIEYEDGWASRARLDVSERRKISWSQTRFQTPERPARSLECYKAMRVYTHTSASKRDFRIQKSRIMWGICSVLVYPLRVYIYIYIHVCVCVFVFVCICVSPCLQATKALSEGRSIALLCF
jgi:hypothetical protein